MTNDSPFINEDLDYKSDVTNPTTYRYNGMTKADDKNPSKRVPMGVGCMYYRKSARMVMGQFHNGKPRGYCHVYTPYRTDSTQEVDVYKGFFSDD